MLAIGVMTEADVGYATQLATEEKWGHLEEDFRRLLHLEPEGCFVAWRAEDRVGIVTTTSCGDYAFLGSLIVSKRARGRGIGEALLKHAMTYLIGRDVTTIELDGVFPAASLYRRLGFRDKYLSLRFKGEGTKRAAEALPYGPELAEDIVSFDRAKTGLSRERIVGRFVKEFGDSVHVVKRGKLAGYAVVRPRAGGDLGIGPWIAEDQDVAGLLLQSILSKHEGRVLTIGVPEINRDAVRMLLNEGFNYTEPSLRMYWGDGRDYEKNVYAIVSPEKG